MTTKKTTTPAPKKSAKRTARAATAKPAATKGGLRKPQVRILAALKKAGKELTRKEIAEKAPVDNAYCTEWIGSVDPTIRAKNDKACVSLLTMKFVKASEGDGKAVTTYAITPAGIKALESAKAEEKPVATARPDAKAKASTGKWAPKILAFLVKHPESSREAILKGLGTEHFSGALPRLFKAGLVSRKQLKDVRGSAYSITTAGTKALESAKAK
jgi:hypothetical protein